MSEPSTVEILGAHEWDQGAKRCTCGWSGRRSNQPVHVEHMLKTRSLRYPPSSEFTHPAARLNEDERGIIVAYLQRLADEQDREMDQAMAEYDRSSDRNYYDHGIHHAAVRNYLNEEWRKLQPW